jgi:hypothetical protein
MLAATLVSLSAGALVAPAAGTPANRVTPSLVQLGIEPGALQPAGPVLRPPVEAPGPRPRPVLLLSLLAVPLLGGAYWARTRRSAAAAGPARLWRRSWPARLPARAPRTQPPDSSPAASSDRRWVLLLINPGSSASDHRRTRSLRCEPACSGCSTR